MRFDKRRNAVIAVAIALIFLTSIYAYGSTRGAAKTVFSGGVDKEYRGIVRFHVIANSNSDYDQEMKLAVRDRVLEVMNEKLIAETMKNYDGKEASDTENGIEAVKSAVMRTDEKDEEAKSEAGMTAKLDIDEVKALITENLDEIEEIAEEVIREYGSDYEAHAELGVRFIPKKTYGDVTFPAGNYEALNITIGEGEGESWWCVLFPPLCLIDPTGESLEGIETDGIGEGTSEIQLKFKTQEIIEQWT